MLICKIILSLKNAEDRNMGRKTVACAMCYMFEPWDEAMGSHLIFNLTLWDLVLTLKTFPFRMSEATTENWLSPRVGLRGVLRSLHFPHPPRARTRTFSASETEAGLKGEEQLMPFLSLFCLQVKKCGSFSFFFSPFLFNVCSLKHKRLI